MLVHMWENVKTPYSMKEISIIFVAMVFKEHTSQTYSCLLPHMLVIIITFISFRIISSIFIYSTFGG